ncbi:TAXI family TRAP transporter solute-binding subunit [Bacillus sp. REN10]|uniref:TAXI family TRAP transporter solute-binding subunit n=1 Tax=Bacillus sp. REN10 TaxID=2782541 RepID=UPI001EEF4532|nr:TAXI family TRAP transporter solute-binding subunit [Bacillus sp. REN10]
MRKWSSRLFLVMVFAFMLIVSACSNGEQETGREAKKAGNNKNISIATGGTGGTYYPLGGSMANIITDHTGIEANAQSSGASAENLTAIKNGDVDIAFTQTDIASYAVSGKEMFKGAPIENFQGIGTLYPETIQIVTTKDSGIKSVSDLKGKTVSVGAPGSGTAPNAQQILELYGLTFDDIKKQDLSFDESTDGIQSGSIDAAFITAGTPTGAVEALSAQKEVKIIPIEKEKVQALIKKYPYYSEDMVPKGTYKIAEDVPTVAVKAMLVVSNALDEESVYKITKAIFDNTDKITHAKGKLIKAETALEGLGDLPLHPGAEKYFKEKGVAK